MARLDFISEVCRKRVLTPALSAGILPNGGEHLFIGDGIDDMKDEKETNGNTIYPDVGPSHITQKAVTLASQVV